jgi:hypothetical protein
MKPPFIKQRDRDNISRYYEEYPDTDPAKGQNPAMLRNDHRHSDGPQPINFNDSSRLQS